MSHEISEIDQQEGTEMAWHNLTKVQEIILLASCWLSKWDVISKVMGVMDSTGKFIAGEYCQLIASDNEAISIGAPVHAETYTVLTNAGFLAIVQNAMDQIRGAIVSSVGSVCRRGRIFVSIKLPQMETFMAAGREFKPYLNFLSSHDKSSPFIVNLGTICTVCNNTFNMNLADTDGDKLRITVRHTSGMKAALADVPAIISAFFTSVQKFAEVMNALVQIPISADDARAFFAGFLTDKMDNETGEMNGTEKKEISSRRVNQIARLLELFNTGKGNHGQNLADVFSALTDYYSHENSGGEDKMKQVASSEFGTGQTMKAFAFAILQDDKRIAQTIANGRRVIQLIPS